MNNNQIGTNLGVQLVLNLIIEILISQDVVKRDRLILMIEGLITEMRSKLDPTTSEAAMVLDQILRPLKDLDRNNTRKLLNDPPVGNS